MNRRNIKELISIVLSLFAALLVFLVLLLGLKWNVILCMILSAVLYIALTMILKPAERIGKVDISGLANKEQIHEKLSEAESDFQRIKKATSKIQNRELHQECQELLAIAESVLKYLTKNPQKISAARRYIDYYQETAANILEHYTELQETKLTPDEMQKTFHNTKEAVSTLQKAFQIQFEKLMQNELMDMDADLNLLKQTLQSEGYQEYTENKVGKE